MVEQSKLYSRNIWGDRVGSESAGKKLGRLKMHLKTHTFLIGVIARFVR